MISVSALEIRGACLRHSCSIHLLVLMPVHSPECPGHQSSISLQLSWGTESTVKTMGSSSSMAELLPALCWRVQLRPFRFTCVGVCKRLQHPPEFPAAESSWSYLVDAAAWLWCSCSAQGCGAGPSLVALSLSLEGLFWPVVCSLREPDTTNHCQPALVCGCRVGVGPEGACLQELPQRACDCTLVGSVQTLLHVHVLTHTALLFVLAWLLSPAMGRGGQFLLWGGEGSSFLWTFTTGGLQQPWEMVRLQEKQHWGSPQKRCWVRDSEDTGQARWEPQATQPRFSFRQRNSVLGQPVLLFKSKDKAVRYTCSSELNRSTALEADWCWKQVMGTRTASSTRLPEQEALGTPVPPAPWEHCSSFMLSYSN